MDHLQTPVRNKNKSNNVIILPPSPFLNKIGYGTGAAVYKMERTQDGKYQSPWAIKKITLQDKEREYEKRLNYEATVLRKLEHENIVGYRGIVKSSKGMDCLAMEECSQCLGSMIEDLYEASNSDPFPASKILKVAYDISKALKYLHEVALLLHGDIKSYNILVKGNFEVCKLCDFGVAIPVDKTGNIDYSKTSTSTNYIGTGPWCSPEILNEPVIITTKADIYAYGLVLFEMMALKPPFEDEDSSLNLDDTTLSDSFIFNRPKLPPYDFDDSYTTVIELFFCCTEPDYLKRPCADDLVSMMNTENESV